VNIIKNIFFFIKAVKQQFSINIKEAAKQNIKNK